jgi:hypothetical protein
MNLLISSVKIKFFLCQIIIVQSLSMYIFEKNKKRSYSTKFHLLLKEFTKNDEINNFNIFNTSNTFQC